MFKMMAMCVMVIAVWYLPNEELKHTEDSLKAVKERVTEKKAFLVDVRDVVEWNDGHIGVRSICHFAIFRTNSTRRFCAKNCQREPSFTPTASLAFGR